MRKFLVNVNGTSYEVAVEEIAGGAAPVAATVAAPIAAPVAAAAPVVAPAAPAGPVSGQSVSAPMPGNIVGVSVKVGDAVKEGQVLLVLEAMKMENEIMSPYSGVVKAVNVAVGISVNTGDALVVIG